MEPLEICFNTLSTPAPSDLESTAMLEEALQGIQLLLTSPQHTHQQAFIYYETDTPLAIVISTEGLTLKGFIKNLEQKNPDLAAVFLELTTQAPFTSFIDDTEIYKLATHSYSINGHHKNIDVLLHALDWNMYLLSLPTHGWDKSTVTCHSQDSSLPQLTIKNICRRESAIAHIESETPTFHSTTVGRCKLYIYFNDHPPPHIHIRGADSKCSINIKPDAIGQIICGHLDKSDRNIVMEYVQKERDAMFSHWNTNNPKK